MKSIGIIPARGGSKGIPNKNIIDLSGKPLIAYTIEAALASNLTEVIVSTDSDQIAEISESLGVKVIMRPAELAQDDTPTLPVLQDIIARLDESYDCVVTLQPTSPLRKAHDINEALQMFENDPSADSLVSVIKVPHNMIPECLMKYDNEGYLTPYLESDVKLRRQDKPSYFARNGAAIYITRTPNLNEYIFGGKIIAYKMSSEDSIDIDNTSDLNLTKKILES
jgi:CMP-N,N'-diacetyllegionaminic acid synthase